MLINRLIIPFLISFCCTLFFSHLRLIFFAPFLIITYYKRPLLPCLWMALGCGLIVDLLSSYDRFGLTSFNYCLCTLLLYYQRQNFFADRVSTLPLMTFFFSVLSTLAQVLLIGIFEKPLPLSWNWMATDLLMMPLFDATFAFIFFVIPPYLLGYRPKKGEDYFL